jgi:hypothetical protein
MLEKKSRVERLRSYSKNVSEMYAPKHSARHNIPEVQNSLPNMSVDNAGRVSTFEGGLVGNS